MIYNNMTVLIVDDVLENIQITMEAIKPLGCKFLYAKNGREGVLRAKQNMPDLILLDIMIPMIDGFETCKILKNDYETKNIPIIFLSAIDANTNIIKGFKLGAVDYIVKPFQAAELVARVSTHLRLHCYEKKLKKRLKSDVEKIISLQAEAKKKELILVEQSKIVSMGEMLKHIAHQWRQSLSVITTASSGIIIQKEYDVLTDEILLNAINSITSSAEYLSNTIDDFRNFYQEDKVKKFFYIKNAINEAIKLLSSKFKNRDINIILDLEHFEINGFKNELIQVFMNLLNNSKDVLEEMNIEKKIIKISTKVINKNLIISFQDNGKGISKDILSKIFDYKFTTKSHKEGTGIGLYISKLIIEKAKGSIEIKNSEFEYNKEYYSGANFIINIPCK